MIIATSTLIRTFGIVAPTLTILQCLAQANRIRTTGAKGVSLATWILSAFVSQIWFCYGIIFHVTAEVVANVPGDHRVPRRGLPRRAKPGQDGAQRDGLSHGDRRHDPRHVRRVVPRPALGASDASRSAVRSSSTCRNSRWSSDPKDLSGVSIISWCLACLTSLGWLVYGFLIHQPALAIPELRDVPSAFIIFVQASRHRIQNNPRTGLQAPIVE